MPEKILELLKKYSLTKEQIAEKLNISLSELESIMDYLQQMNYIKSTIITPTQTNCSSGCSGNCGKCSDSCNQPSNSSYIVWELI